MSRSRQNAMSGETVAIALTRALFYLTFRLILWSGCYRIFELSRFLYCQRRSLMALLRLYCHRRLAVITNWLSGVYRRCWSTFTAAHPFMQSAGKRRVDPSNALQRPSQTPPPLLLLLTFQCANEIMS